MFKMYEHGYYPIILIILAFIGNSHQETQCHSIVTQPTGQIRTPNYPGSYPKGISCEWQLKLTKNSSILLVFKDFYTYEQDHLLIYENSTLAGNFSGARNHPKHFVSKTNQLVLKFSSKEVRRKGFDIHFEAIDHGCGGQYHDKGDVIKSPGYPNNYYDNMNCEWSVDCPANRTLIIKFTDFHLEQRHAHLTIVDRSSMVTIANLSGDSFPSDLITRTNRLLIRFRSDHSPNSEHYRGFSLSYSSLTMGLNVPMFITVTNAVIRALPNRTLDTTYTSVNEYRLIEWDSTRSKLILWDPTSHNLVLDFPDESGNAVHSRPDCLTFDPIHGIVFWIDMQSNTINAMDIKQEMMTTLVQLESHHSRHLLVNILWSRLIWSDISSEPKIWQMECDGTNRTVLYSCGRQALHLTADYRTERYYFVDITDYSLISIDFFGQNARSHMTSRILFDSIITMSVLNNDLYLANNLIIYKIPDLGLGINRAEIIYYTDNQDNLYTKSELFYQIKPVNLNRPKIFGFKLIDDLSMINLANKCNDRTKCDGFCLPNSVTFRCLSQSLTTVPVPVTMGDKHQDTQNVLAIFNSVLIVFLIGLVALVAFYLSQRITKLDNQFNQVIKPCATFIRDEDTSDISNVYANNEYEDPVYVMRNS